MPIWGALSGRFSAGTPVESHGAAPGQRGLDLDRRIARQRLRARPGRLEGSLVAFVQHQGHGVPRRPVSSGTLARRCTVLAAVLMGGGALLGPLVAQLAKGDPPPPRVLVVRLPQAAPPIIHLHARCVAARWPARRRR